MAQTANGNGGFAAAAARRQPEAEALIASAIEQGKFAATGTSAAEAASELPIGNRPESPQTAL
jgi:hypothetical protein